MQNTFVPHIYRFYRNTARQNPRLPAKRPDRILFQPQNIRNQHALPVHFRKQLLVTE